MEPTSWDHLIVEKVDSLPEGVFLSFMSSAMSPIAAAQRKAQSAGIPGGVTLIQQHPLNKATGKSLFNEVLGFLTPFPYGDSHCLVKASTASIARKYKQHSSKDPEQIELRRMLIEQQVTEQLCLPEKVKQERSDISSKVAADVQQVEKLQLRIESLKEQICTLEKERQEKESEIDQMVELWSEKSLLKEEILELEQRLADLQDELGY